MTKELNYYNIAGDLQTKAYQFNALGSDTGYNYNKEECALKYINDIIYDLKEYKKLIKKELIKKEKQEEK